MLRDFNNSIFDLATLQKSVNTSQNSHVTIKHRTVKICQIRLFRQEQKLKL